MADLMSLLQLLGAGSVGAVVAQYVSAAPERRQTRATAREAIAALEQARWSRGEDGEWAALRRAVQEFESAALIAGVPREVSRWYVRTTVAIHRESARSWEEHPDPEFGGGVSTRHMDAFESATELVYDVMWHPQRSRLTWRRRLRASKKLIMTATADSPAIQRALTTRQGAA